MTGGVMLSDRGLSIADRPVSIFQYGLNDHTRISRAIVADFELGLGDNVALEALFDDAHRLAVHRSVYGNRPTPVRRVPTPVLLPVPSLFDAPEAA